MLILADLKEGDTVIRILAGHPMEVVVGVVTPEHVYCGSPNGFVPATVEAGWKFRKDNGLEVDEDLGWDGLTRTGSYIKVHNT